MAEDRNQFHLISASGFMRETNQWTLVTDTASGTQIVEHAWTYFDPFGVGKLDHGKSMTTVDNFLMGSTDDVVKQKLRDALLGVQARFQ